MSVKRAKPRWPQVIRLQSRLLPGRGVPHRPACRASATPEWHHHRAGATSAGVPRLRCAGRRPL